MKFGKEYRSRKRIQAFLDNVDLPQDGKLLDLSCGEGKLLKAVAARYPKLHVSGIDMSTEAISAAKENVPSGELVLGNVEKLPFENNTFDFIVCSMTFHHYEHLDSILSEVKRVMKDRATFAVLDLIPANAFSQKYYNRIQCPEPYHFEKFYTMPELESVMTNAGFKKQKEVKATFYPRTVLSLFTNF